MGRFLLLSPLECGKSAAARFLSREETDEPGEYEWVSGDREVPIHATPGVYNHLPAGAEVTAELTAAGWRARMDELWGVLPSGFNPFPYAVLRMSHVSSMSTDAVQLMRPGTGGVPLWDDDYVFTAAAVSASPAGDTLPDETIRARWIPCTPLLPAKAAYKRFDGLLANGDPIPGSILQAMNQEPHPSSGELWGPTYEGRLSRTFSFLEIFWWELCSPAWECVPGQIPNPDYDPDADVCDLFHPDYDPDNIVCQPTIDGQVWGIVCDGEVVARAAADDGGNIPCTDPPPGRRAAFWRSPIGWWGLGCWNWNWWWGVGWWRYPYGWWNGGFPAWNVSWWWGPFGYGWWTHRWGGRPPTDDDLLELTAGDMPDPPCGGGVIRRTRFGFIVWESGWRVLGADTDNEVATIVGPLKFREPYLVVENPEPPDSACDQGYGAT